MREKILKILETNPTISNKDLAILCNCSKSNIQYYLRVLNIHRDRLAQQRVNNTNRDNPCVISNTAEQIILGSILGDGSIAKNRHPTNTSLTLNSYLEIIQGVKQYEYLQYKKELLEKEGIVCYIKKRKPPKKTHYINNKEVLFNGSYELRTKRNSSFNKYRELFYREKKYINKYIYKLNVLGLAIWYMDDGTRVGKNSSVSLCTNCFTIKDLKLLQKVLKHNFNLDTSLHKARENQYTIYIRKHSLSRFLELVSPHIIESMRYKLVLNSVNLGKS